MTETNIPETLAEIKSKLYAMETRYNDAITELRYQVAELQSRLPAKQKFIKSLTSDDFSRIVQLRLEIFDNGTGYRGKRKLKAKMFVWLDDTKPLNGHLLPFMFWPMEPMTKDPDWFFSTLQWSGKNKLYNGTVQGTVKIKSCAVGWNEKTDDATFVSTFGDVHFSEKLAVSIEPKAPIRKYIWRK